MRTSDESAAENRVVPGWRNRSGLDHDSEDENADIDQDRILSRDDLGQEAAVQSSEPSSKLENGRQPALLGAIPCQSSLIFDVASHVCN